MIQRIQSVYLFMAALISGGLTSVLMLWLNNAGVQVFAWSTLSDPDILIKIVGILFYTSTLLSLIAIFLFKIRTTQIAINRLNIIINFFLLGVIVYHLLILPGETAVSEKGIGSFLPIFVIVLLVLANRSILKDEKLVKSVERLR